MPEKPAAGSKTSKAHISNLKINFLRGDGSNLATQVVSWISNFGLPILYVVAGIVFAASIYKLTLDQKLIDIEQQIMVAADTTVAYQPTERRLNSITSKYKDVEDYWLAERITVLLPKLTLVVPNSVQLNELAITPDSVRFSGFANSKAATATLVNNIQAIQNTAFPEGQTVEFYNIRIEDISTTSIVDSTFSFSVRFEYSIKDSETTSI